MVRRSALDRGLQVRMTVLALLVVLANLAFVALVLDAGLYMANVVIGLLIDHSRHIVPHYNRLVVVPVTVLFMLGQYWYIRRSILRSPSVTTATPTVATLEARVTRLATQASVTPPSVAVVDSSVPNCYTVGRRGNATIVVSTGLCETLDDAELDAVLAHELAHVLNRDVTVMTMAVAPFRLTRSLVTTLDRGLTVIGLTVYIMLHFGAVVATIATGLILVVLPGFRGVYDVIVTIVPGIDPGPIVGFEILTVVTERFTIFIEYLAEITAVLLVGGLFLVPVVLALSIYYVVLGVVPRRLAIYREYAADRGAALVTGNPAALASALLTLSTAPNRPSTDLRQATDIQALCLIPDRINDEIDIGPIRQAIADDWPLIETFFQRIPTGIVAHPPISDRIARLRDMAQTFENQ